MNFKELAEQNEQWIIDQRRFFHQCPELSFEEKNTTKEIGKRLEEMGVEPHYYDDYTGLWAMIEAERREPARRRWLCGQTLTPFPWKSTQVFLSAAKTPV